MLQEPSVAVYTAEQRDMSQHLCFCPPMQFLFRGSDSIELGLGLELCREGQADNGGEERRGGAEGQRGRVGGAEGEGGRGRGGGWEGQKGRGRGGGWEGQRGRVGGTDKRDVGEWEGQEEGRCEDKREEYVGVA